jgi:hypothetical protein
MTSTTKTMTSEPGVYRSDLDGHLFVLKVHPVILTCVICMKSCDRSNYKNHLLFKDAAAAFTNEHGFLDERIGSNLAEIIPPRSTK